MSKTRKLLLVLCAVICAIALACGLAACSSKKAVESISVSDNSITLEEGSSKDVTVTVTPEDADDTGWSVASSNASVASASKKDDVTVTITAVAAADSPVTITITADADESVTVTITVTVTTKEDTTPTTPTVSSVAINEESVELTVGNTATFTATVTMSDNSSAYTGTITWASSDTSVATVSNGTVTAVAAGTAEITATAGGVTSTAITVTVKAAEENPEEPTPDEPTASVTGVAISSQDISLEVGGEVTLTASVTMSDSSTYDGTVTWTSSDPSVATVSDEGKVTAIAVGTAEITASVGDVTSEAITVTVTEATENPEEPTPDEPTETVYALEISNTDVALTINGEDTGSELVTITATYGTESADWTYTPSDGYEDIFSIEPAENGLLIKAAAVGEGYITISAGEGEDAVTKTIKVTVTDGTSEPEETTYTFDIQPEEVNLTITDEGYGTAVVEITVTNDLTGEEVDWVYTSSDENEAIVSITGAENGLSITAKSAGTVYVTVYVDGDEDAYTTIKVTVTDETSSENPEEPDEPEVTYELEVDPTDVDLTFNGTEYGTKNVTISATNSNGEDVEYSISGSENYTDVFTYTTTDTGITITAAGEGEGTLTVTINGTETSETIYVTVTDETRKAAPSVSIFGDTEIFIPGNSTTLTLEEENGYDITSVTWSSATTTVATISGSGEVVTVTGAGLFGSSLITASAVIDGTTYTATTTVYVTAEYFYLYGLNSSWVVYQSSDAAENAGALLNETTESSYIYSRTFDITPTEWGWEIGFYGIDGNDDGNWDYEIYPYNYFDATNSSDHATTVQDGGFNITEKGTYTVTLDLTDGVGKVTITLVSVDITAVSLTASGSAELEYGTNNSVTYTVSVTPSDASFTDEEFEFSVNFTDYDSYLTIEKDYSSMTVTVTVTAEPDSTVTGDLVVSIAGVSSTAAEFTVKGNSTIAVDHVAFDETSYSYDVNNGGQAWTTTVKAYGYGESSTYASESGVTYSTTDTDYITVDAATGAVTATGLGTFTVTATSTSNPEKSASVEITFYSDTFFLLGNPEYSGDWSYPGSSTTTLDAIYADYAFTDDGTHKTFTLTVPGSDWTGNCFICYLGGGTWDTGLFGNLINTSKSSSNYYWTEGTNMSFANGCKVTLDLSGTTPSIIVTAN